MATRPSLLITGSSRGIGAATAMMAAARGYDVAFVEDASSGLSEERVAAVLAQWRDGGVRFTTTDEVVAATP